MLFIVLVTIALHGKSRHSLDNVVYLAVLCFIADVVLEAITHSYNDPYRIELIRLFMVVLWIASTGVILPLNQIIRPRAKVALPEHEGL